MFFSGGRDIPMPDGVSITNCDESQDYCEVSRSETNHVFFNFTAPTDIKQLNGQCHVSMGKIWLNVPIGKYGDVCSNLVVGSCPLKQGSKASYSISSKIPKAAPVGRKAKVRVRAIDENKNTQGCIQISVRIVK